MKIRYFKDNKAYFNFINKYNKNINYKRFFVSFTKKHIKVIYEII